MVDMFTYTVIADFADDQAREEYLAWMRGGHMAKVIELGAAVSGQVARLDDGRIESRYIFPDRATFTAYESGPAIELRAEGARFSAAGKASFTRHTGEIVFDG